MHASPQDEHITPDTDGVLRESRSAPAQLRQRKENLREQRVVGRGHKHLQTPWEQCEALSPCSWTHGESPGAARTHQNAVLL
ncbi:hypothetical protein Q5P01_005800 [Channa striata]|uniref:Uncharacterized protein n=1 Tax=Channa striata TaxID=64152 RepID=A0AA88T1K9_CHASR|nr:hypothetical protein Q5P01_005800 [Channa striata]